MTAGRTVHPSGVTTPVPPPAVRRSPSAQPSWIDELSRTTVSGDVAAEIGLDGSELLLRRAWPRSDEHVLLELETAGGRTIAAQWMRDGEHAARALAETAHCCPLLPLATIERAGGTVLLQPGGADRALPSLSTLVARPGVELLSHRPESRAVARTVDPGSGRVRYVKVVAPDRIERLLAPLRQLGRSAHSFRLPAVRAVSPENGWVTLDEVAGRSLHQLMGEPRAFVAGLAASGRCLRELHRSSGLELRRHRADRVVKELRRRASQLAALDAPMGGRVQVLLEPIAAALGDGLERGLVPVHRDFHDKQVLLDRDGTVGILDFDTLSLAEPEIDVANALAHLELRTFQGLCTSSVAHAAAVAFLDGYGAGAASAERTQTYLDATRLRLATLYTLRPRWHGVASLLLDGIGRGGPETSPSPVPMGRSK